MADVYLAEQAEPVKRFVALKILKPGMDSRQIVARFESERKALALLGPPEHRQDLRRRHGREWPAILCNGVCGWQAHHPVLR